MGIASGALGALLGVLLGFLLTALWDHWKEKRRRERERTRLAYAIWAELIENGGKAEGMRDSIRTITDRSLDTEYELTLSPLGIDAWKLALFHWDVLQLEEPLQPQLSAIYAHGEHINSVIRLREGFLIGQNTGVARSRDKRLLELLNEYTEDSQRLAPEVLKGVPTTR